MAITQNTFEGGTSGAGVTTANSGGASGAAWDFSDIVAPATITYSTTAANGSRAASVVANGARAYLSWYLPTTTKLSLRFYIRIASMPSTELQILTPRSSSNYVSGFNLTTAGRLKLTSASPGTPTLFTATDGMALNTWYRVEVSWEIGTTTANGKVQLKYFAGDSTTAIESFTATTANLGTLPMEELRWGKLGTSGNVSLLYDSIAYDPSTVTLLGPYAAVNTPPIANAGTGQTNVEPGTMLTLNGSGSSDPDGTIVSYTWTQTAGATVTLSGTGATRTFKAPYTVAGTTLAFRLRVTDNDSAFTEATVTHTVLPCTERAVVGGAEVPLEIRLATS